ncbi:MAG: hypothetical protein RBG13Loki_2168 [Promethearchaeota archaeon CR_4]|nr:MAG: hypothetical protein RBG13Loki_2168 [Candidatus Lokiarchaeota archaeon CR_4]
MLDLQVQTHFPGSYKFLVVGDVDNTHHSFGGFRVREDESISRMDAPTGCIFCIHHHAKCGARFNTKSLDFQLHSITYLNYPNKCEQLTLIKDDIILFGDDKYPQFLASWLFAKLFCPREHAGIRESERSTLGQFPSNGGRSQKSAKW